MVAELKALEDSVDMILSGIEFQVNRSELNDEIHFENISNSISILATILGEQHNFASSAAILKLFHIYPSGYYNIRSSNGSAITAYCYRTRSCGDITGGWMRVAELDMRNTTTQCLDSLELRTILLRTCTTVNTDRATCSSDVLLLMVFNILKYVDRLEPTRSEQQMLFF